ncbi:DUF559 domain-containing protein [Methylocystis sp.]
MTDERPPHTESCGYRVIRFDNAHLYENIEAVMEVILADLHGSG